MRQSSVVAESITNAPESVRVPAFTFTPGVHGPSALIPRHSHDNPTMCYVLRGRFSEHSAGKVADCVPETLKLTPAGEVHWNSFADTETRGLRVDVHREHFRDFPAILRMLDDRIVLHRPAAGQLARRILLELYSGDAAGLIAAEGLALELVAELAREADPRESSRCPDWLCRADEMVRDSVGQHRTIAEIAEAAGVSSTTLARGYRRRFGCTVGGQMRRLRIESAARALVETQQRLSTIALAAGFYDQSHFANSFRRYMGVTPAEYRSRLG